MLITRKSMLTGKTHTMDIPVSQEHIAAWEEGMCLIQEAMPDLTDEQREFIKSGITPEEWDAAFGDDD